MHRPLSLAKHNSIAPEKSRLEVAVNEHLERFSP